MWMTGSEKAEMLSTIEQMKKLNEQKNAAIDKIVAYCAMLEKENELLRNQLEIAEWHIMHKGGTSQ